MGRKKKYKTSKDKKEARKRWNKKYYDTNKDRLNKETMDRYYEEKKVS